METTRIYNWPAILLLAAIIVIVVIGGYTVHRVVPCLTGEVRSSTAMTADGRTLVATAPVCPEEGQVVFRSMALIALTGLIVITAVKVVMDADAKGDAAVATAALALGRLPQSMTGRLAAAPDIIDAEVRLAEAQERRQRAGWYGRRDTPGELPDFTGLFDAPPVAPAARTNGHNGGRHDGQ